MVSTLQSRISSLVAEREELNERWDAQNSLLVDGHERYLGELTDVFEGQVGQAPPKHLTPALPCLPHLTTSC